DADNRARRAGRRRLRRDGRLLRLFRRIVGRHEELLCGKAALAGTEWISRDPPSLLWLRELRVRVPDTRRQRSKGKVFWRQLLPWIGSPRKRWCPHKVAGPV